MTFALPLSAPIRGLARRPAGGYLALLLLTLLMFADLLLPGGNRVLGDGATDMSSQFLSWRQYGYGELARGHLALWNPHVFAGAPYFGGFQSALLYPPNLIFLLLPTPLAINWSIALHVFLLGAFTQAWALRRGLLPAAACLSGALAMFCGAFFLHIYAGHLTNICAMAWAPLVFLAIDALADRAAHAGDGSEPAGGWLGWCLLGSMAVNLQILAGHPQYVFYTAVAAAIYGLLRLAGARRRGRLLAGFATIAGGGAALAALQLLVGLGAAAETVRNKALSFDMASTFSLPPENLLTLVAPGLLGSLAPAGYFGRGYLWEMSLYMGVTGSLLAFWGVCRGSALSGARRRDMAIAVGALLLLALGANTPLFQLLYTHVPGFDRFRGNAKFVFPASLFIALLAGIGFDALLRTRRAGRGLLALVFSAAGLLLLLTLLASRLDWLPLLHRAGLTGESSLLAQLYADPAGAAKLAAVAALAQNVFMRSLLGAAAVALLFGALLVWLRREPRAVWLIGALALAEVLSVAAASRASFHNVDPDGARLGRFLGAHPGDYRIANALNPNVALTLGAQEMGGNDPGVVRRYAELMTFLAGGDPDRATQYLDFSRPDPLHALLRLRYVLAPAGDGRLALTEQPDPMPRAALIGRYRLVQGRDAIFAALKDQNFDFRRELVLESVPDPLPSADPQGTVTVVEQSGDALTIEAETARPALLLVTDLYTPAWRARALVGSSQLHYQLMPADYALRAVPLAAGKHRISIEYHPSGWSAGLWTSAITLLLWSGAAVYWWRRRARASAG